MGAWAAVKEGSWTLSESIPITGLDVWSVRFGKDTGSVEYNGLDEILPFEGIVQGLAATTEASTIVEACRSRD